MKIKLLYNPEDGPEVEWDIDPARLLSVEAEMLEALGGGVWRSYGDFWPLVADGNIRSWRALLWLMLHRANPKLRFEDVVFRLDEFGVDVDEETPDEEPPKDELNVNDTDSPSAMPDLPPVSENSTDGQSVSSMPLVTG